MTETLFYEGSTYYLQKTLSPFSGTGFVSTSLENLNTGTTYSILIAAFNNNGLSDISSPIIFKTDVAENRPPIICTCWDWYDPVLNNMVLYQTGNTVNMIHSSEDITNSVAWNGAQRFNITSGHTAPDGSTGGFAILGASGSQSVGGVGLYQELALEYGNTYIYSFYHKVTDGATGFRVGGYYKATSAIPNANAVFGTNPILFRQILPVTGPYENLATVRYPVGATGWQRFAFEFYAFTPHRYIFVFTGWYNSTNRFPQYFWGPQLEKVTP
jgi:hypothetical protein